MEPKNQRELADAIDALLRHCRSHDWAGWDPFDGLNSPLFRLPFLQNHFCRLAFIQFCKRSPVNFRPLFRVPMQQNPKGIALFATAILKLSRLGLCAENEGQCLLDRLLQSRSAGQEHSCWGYNFDWQTRAFLVPRFTPNIICTTFAGNALMDGFEMLNDKVYLNHAVAAGHFLLTGLNRTTERNSICFSYTPLDRERIHNANLLGAAFLGRLYRHVGVEEFRVAAQASIRFTVERIWQDGSWPYGEEPRQQWIDSFHTGYNLLALERSRQWLGDDSLEPVIEKAYRYFVTHLLTEHGTVKYFHDREFPIDTHAVATAIITLVELKRYDNEALDRAWRILRWALQNMRAREGWFFYQKRAGYTVKIPYIRWTQAWMLAAMATLSEATSYDRKVPSSEAMAAKG